MGTAGGCSGGHRGCMAVAPTSPAASAGRRLPARRDLERDWLVFSRKGVIPSRPSPEALHEEAAFTTEKAQVGE